MPKHTRLPCHWKWFIMLSFTRLWVMELYFGETHHIVPQILACKRRHLGLRKDVTIEIHIEMYLRNYKFCFWHRSICYIFLLFVVQNKNLFSTSIENHNIDIRQRDNLYLPQANLTIYQKEAYYLGIKIFNNLPVETKNVAGNQKKFKNCSKKYLYTY